MGGERGERVEESSSKEGTQGGGWPGENGMKVL